MIPDASDDYVQYGFCSSLIERFTNTLGQIYEAETPEEQCSQPSFTANVWNSQTSSCHTSDLEHPFVTSPNEPPRYDLKGSFYDASAYRKFASLSGPQRTTIEERLCPQNTRNTSSATGTSFAIRLKASSLLCGISYQECKIGRGILAKECSCKKLDAEDLRRAFYFSRFGSSGNNVYGTRRLIYIPHLAVASVAALASLVSACCMHNYDFTHATTHPEHLAYLKHIPLLSLKEPTPTLFVTATIIHGLSTLTYYNTRRSDRFREAALVTGAVGGTCAGLWAGTTAENILVGVLPMATIASLLLFTGVNTVWEAFIRYGYCEKGKGDDLESQDTKG
ncbi:hypothetical protein P171DRAFT_431373 [Karstenula rhodostoma CBS 690.94]|uniref:Uncharacterized protein n=1 Tax=Karstenula rhodostoma CBS 690.94 TaxID=1392251 RepID=A0A9P4UD66_9PLEO|nr:hypothetical protein P171DRAFT_431373 [Karstenula rhodostoma CBS 690.94]